MSESLAPCILAVTILPYLALPNDKAYRILRLHLYLSPKSHSVTQHRHQHPKGQSTFCTLSLAACTPLSRPVFTRLSPLTLTASLLFALLFPPRTRPLFSPKSLPQTVALRSLIQIDLSINFASSLLQRLVSVPLRRAPLSTFQACRCPSFPSGSLKLAVLGITHACIHSLSWHAIPCS